MANKTPRPSNSDKTLADFLKGRSEHTVTLFQGFVSRYKEHGALTIHPAKTMIGLAARKRFVYITRLGKDFVDIVFPFNKPYHDNLCFHKIARVPGTDQYNHHFRMCSIDDLNEEVVGFMKLAYENGK